MKSKTRSSILLLLKIAVSFIAVYYLLSKLSLHELINILNNIHYVPIIAALSLCIVDRLLQSYKWTFLINSYGVKVKYIDAIATDMMGNFAGQFLPSGFGGDVVRVFLLKRVGLPLLQTTASIFVERLFGVFSLITCALIVSILFRILDYRIPQVIFKLTIVLFIILLILIFFSFTKYFSTVSSKVLNYFKPKNKSKYLKSFEALSSALDAYLHFNLRKTILLKYYILSVLEVFTVCIIFFMTSAAIPVGLNFIKMVLIVPPVLLLQRIPISINGIGVQEGLLAYFLNIFHIEMQISIAFIILIRVIGIFILLPGGLLFFIKKKTKPENIRQN